MTDADYVPAHRLSAELGVEAGNACDACRRYLRDLTDAAQGRLGQIPVMPLQRLQNKDDRIRLTTQLRHDAINELQVYVVRVIGGRCRVSGLSRVLCACAGFGWRPLAHRVLASPPTQ